MLRVVWLGLMMLFVIDVAHAQYSPPPLRTFIVHGAERTCDSIGGLDRALRTNDVRYFAGWSAADYDAAAAWSRACVVRGYEHVGAVRVAQLHARQNLQRANASQVAEAARQTEVNRKREAARTVLHEAHDALTDCRSTKRGQLHGAAQSIIADFELKKSGADAIARERQVGAISGTVNKAVLHNAGESIVSADEDIRQQWIVYKKLGGTAESPQKIPRNARDPCADEQSAFEEAQAAAPHF